MGSNYINIISWCHTWFLIALFQIIAQKTELITLKSKVRRLNNELDNLRNQSLDDDIILEDVVESEDTL